MVLSSYDGPARREMIISEVNFNCDAQHREGDYRLISANTADDGYVFLPRPSAFKAASQ